MNVLLVHPSSPFLVDSRTFPPLGVLYLGAALEANGHHVRVLDLAFGGSLDQAHDFDPQLVGISCLTPHYPQLAELVGLARRHFPRAAVVGGGAHFSTCPADGRRAHLDAVGTGDCEEVIVQMCADIAAGGLTREVYAAAGGITDVDRYPIPARHLLSIPDYRYAIAGLPATTIMTQRGCPYECTFCCHWEGYRKMRLRSLDNVATEVAELKAQGFQGVMVYDDETNIVHQRTLALCEVFKSAAVRWRCFIKANLFNEEQARALSASGCWEVCTGVESGSDVVLRTIAKKATVADNTRARTLCREYGVRFKAFCMVGHPGESYASAYATRDWLIQNAPDEFNLSLYTPYLGTPVYDRPADFDIAFDALDYSKDEYFYRGKPGQYQAHASTSALSGAQLATLRDEIENEVRDKLGLPKQGSPMTWNTARTPDTSAACTEVG